VAFLRYVAVRLGQALATLIGVSLLIFVAQRLLPGGFEEMLLGPLTTPEAKRFIVEQYGLDRSPVEQYFAWLLAFAQGDFGLSLITKSSIGAELWRRSPVTVELAVLATTMALLIGLPLGVASGIRESGRALRLIGRLIGAVGTGTPEFVLGSALLYLLSGWSMGFSARGYVSIFEAPRENLGALFVPAGTLAVFGAALIVPAVARGDAPIGIVCHHVLRNAAIPIVTVTATFLGYLLGGALIVEVLFSIPGVGLYAYNALNNRDYAVVQAGVMLSATVFIMINTIADLLYALIDPRVARRIAASAARRR
jgi:peptide/nickel transport system permease protein